jgi:hypothetical protein
MHPASENAFFIASSPIQEIEATSPKAMRPAQRTTLLGGRSFFVPNKTRNMPKNKSATAHLPNAHMINPVDKRRKPPTLPKSRLLIEKYPAHAIRDPVSTK